jgi:hypothetical protein
MKLPGYEYLQKVISYQKLDQIISGLEFWRTRRKLKVRLLLVYKEYSYDHELYALIRFLKKNYTNVDYVGFSANERPRENPGLSSKKLYKKLDEFKPDIVFTYEKILSPAEADLIARSGMKLVTNTCGVHTFAYGGVNSQSDAIDLLRKHTLYLTSHAPHIPLLEREGIRAEEFPFWFEPEWFYPLDVPKLYDVLFLGDIVSPLNSNRLELIKCLSQDHKITLISDYDPGLPNVVCVGSTPSPHKLNVWINQSRLVLGSDRLGNIDGLNNLPGQYIFYEDEYFIRQRAYPIMGAGACYLVERHPQIEKRFKDGEEIILWDDYDDLAAKVKLLLRDASERARIGANARVRCLAEHSVGVRADQFIKLMEDL